MPQLKTTLLFLLLLVSTATLAQDYDLNTYDFRYQKFRGLTTGFDLGSNGSKTLNSRIDTVFRDTVSSKTGRNTNPFKNSLQVKVNSEDNFAIEVNDMNGSTIFTKRDANGDEIITLDGIRKGVYIVTITSGEQVFHYRLVKAQ